MKPQLPQQAPQQAVPQLPQQAPQGGGENVLSGLLREDSLNRDIPYSPGMPQALAQGVQAGQQGSLASLGDSRLIEAMNLGRETGQQEDMRAIRNVIEGRHSDDVARGPQPQAQPITSADQNEQSWWQRLLGKSPFSQVSDTLKDANERGQQDRRDNRLLK